MCSSWTHLEVLIQVFENCLIITRDSSWYLFWISERLWLCIQKSIVVTTPEKPFNDTIWNICGTSLWMHSWFDTAIQILWASIWMLRPSILWWLNIGEPVISSLCTSSCFPYKNTSSHSHSPLFSLSCILLLFNYTHKKPFNVAYNTKIISALTLLTFTP